MGTPDSGITAAGAETWVLDGAAHLLGPLVLGPSAKPKGSNHFEYIPQTQEYSVKRTVCIAMEFQLRRQPGEGSALADNELW
jgi:hypothetical protein